MKRMYIPLALLVISTPAFAATEVFHLTASGTQAANPVQSIDSVFSITFDNSTDVETTPLGSTLGLSSPFGVGINYAYDHRGSTLSIGQTPYLSGIAYPLNSIGFAISSVTTTPFFTFGPPLITAETGQYSFSNFAISRTVAATVPEPASWAMMLAGFGAIGYAMRRRKVALA